MPVNQQANNGVTVVTGVSNPDYQREADLLYYTIGVRRNIPRMQENPSLFLSILVSVIKSKKIYNNSIQAGLLLALTLQE